MRLRPVVALLALCALACSGSKDAPDTGGSSDGEDSDLYISDWDFTCFPEGNDYPVDTLVVEAEVYDAVSVSLEIWSGDTVLGTLSLIERGSDNWYADARASEYGEDCMAPAPLYLVLTAVGANGLTTTDDDSVY